MWVAEWGPHSGVMLTLWVLETLEEMYSVHLWLQRLGFLSLTFSEVSALKKGLNKCLG